MLPREVIEATANACLDFEGSGLSLIETSHRAKNFQPVVDKAVDLVKELLGLPAGYSVVFLGKYDHENECAIKTLRNVPFIKIQREICIHKKVAKIQNVIPLVGVVKDPLTSTISIITKYQKSESPRTLFPKLDLNEIRILMYKLLLSLDSEVEKSSTILEVLINITSIILINIIISKFFHRF